MQIAQLIALLRVAEKDARAETVFVGLHPGAAIKWSLARFASEAADLIERELIEPAAPVIGAEENDHG